MDLHQVGAAAYRRSTLFRDIHDTLNLPAFQRLMGQLKDVDVRDAVVMFMELYTQIQERYPQYDSLEHLGLMDSIFADADKRRVIVQAFNQQKRSVEGQPALLQLGHHSSSQVVASSSEELSWGLSESLNRSSCSSGSKSSLE